MALPELEAPGDDPRHEDDGVLGVQPLLLQLHPGRVGERARDGLRDVLREGRRHGVVEEEEQPPGGADAPHEPAAAVDARPLGLGPLGRRREGGGGGGGRLRRLVALVALVLLVVVGAIAVVARRGRRRLLLLPPP